LRPQLDSLASRVREYFRRNNLSVSRGQVQDMLDDASDLLAFFEDNEVFANNAFQATLALRLSLLLELLQLNEIIGEPDAVLEAVRRSIRDQARKGKAAHEDWRAAFLPVTNGVSVRAGRPCSSRKRNRKCKFSTREKYVSVCSDVQTPFINKPAPFCRRQACKSNHIRKAIGTRRLNPAASKPSRRSSGRRC